MATVTFAPGDKKVEAEVGETLLAISKKNDCGILYSCDGAPSCALCRVSVQSGDEHLSSIERKEEDLIGTSYFITKNRLSCQAKLISDGDVVIDISEHLNRKDKVQKKPSPSKKDKRPPKNERGSKYEGSAKPKKKFYKKKKNKPSDGNGGQNQAPKNDGSSS